MVERLLQLLAASELNDGDYTEAVTLVRELAYAADAGADLAEEVLAHLAAQPPRVVSALNVVPFRGAA